MVHVARTGHWRALAFRRVKTHRTVPGPLDDHQAVTRWRLPAENLAGPA
jgi:hypothetical protein